MGKIFQAPEGFNPPDITKYRDNYNQYWKDCEKYVDDVKKTLKTSFKNVCKEAGEEIRFPVGDGQARYIVATLKPVQLVHVDTGDAWHYQYVHRLTATDIRHALRINRVL